MNTLKVALYPYVPRIAQFQQVIAAEWNKVQPAVSLVWATDWDGGYASDPDSSYDVFVFDALNLSYFQAKNLLYPLTKDQIVNYDDLVPFAREGVTVGEQVLAIPQLGCGDFLFYRASDAALAKVTNAAELTQAMGTCTYYSASPPDGSAGLMVDLAGGTTAASTYLESLYAKYGQFPAPLPTQVDPSTAATLQNIVASSSFGDILYSDDAAPYQRATWFAQGMGRAYVAFTESMSQLDPQTLSSIRLKPMVWSTNSAAISAPLFYSDVVGVGPSTVARGTTALAIQLANLITAPDVIVKIFGPSENAGPQYLMPVSASALRQLAADFPAYQQLATVMAAVTPTLFNLGPDSKSWLSSMKKTLQSVMLASPKCYCDYPSAPIQNNDDAKTKCPAACGTKSWNGQWTSKDGGSVCGCDGACAAAVPNRRK